MSVWYEKTEKRIKIQYKPFPVKQRKHQCNLCEWSFGSLPRLIKHKDTHWESGVYACQVCHSLFNFQHNLYAHWRSSCHAVSNKRTDAEITSIEIGNLRNYVLCVMGMENRAQLFHVFGGAMFLPSPEFLAERHNEDMPQYAFPCHLCCLSVPIKLLECHGDVHRGRFRIDGCVYGNYFCHICAHLFQTKESLIRHWRTACEEVMAYTPDEAWLDDDELTALVWLVLQQSVPHKTIADMGRNTQQMLERWSAEHAKSHHLKDMLHEYYHFPQEIWPLQTQVDQDIVADAIPIRGKNTFFINNKKYPVHSVNLLATMCPEFYATGMAFLILCSSESDDSPVKNVYRVILRYTNAGSVINTYKFTARTCPRLRPQHTKYNIESDGFTCTHDHCKNQLSAISFISKARYDDHENHIHKKSFWDDYWCPLCKRIIRHRSSLEHWEEDCVVLKEILPDVTDRQMCDYTFVLWVSKLFQKQKDKIVITMESETCPIDELLHKEPKFKGKQKSDSLRDIVKTVFEKPEEVQWRKLLRTIEPEFRKAKKRFEKLMNAERDFVPSGVILVICPHCGGRFHNDLLVNHLEQRHSYPKESQIMRYHFDKWKRSRFVDTLQVFADMIAELGAELSPQKLLSKEQYEKCLEFNFKDMYLKKEARFIATWQEDKTLRPVTINGPLRLIGDIQQKSKTDAVIAPEPDFDAFEQIFPEGKEPEQHDPKSRVQDAWLPENKDLLLKDVEYVDPMSGKPLPPELAAVQKRVDEIFLKGFRREAHTNGVLINSLTDFFRCSAPPDGEKPKVQYVELDVQQDSYVSDEKVAKALEEDKMIEPYQSDSDEEIVDNDVEDLDPDLESDDDVGDKEFHAEDNLDALKARRALVIEARYRQRMISREAIIPPPYEKRNFAPMYTEINPARAKNLNFLTSVIPGPDIANDHKTDELRPLALDWTIENEGGDFRSSAVKFREHYSKYLSMTKTTEVLRHVNGLCKRDTEKMQMHEEMLQDNVGDGVVDRKGTAYIGGYIKPSTFQRKHNEVFYVVFGFITRKFQVFECEDRRGKFKFVWPIERTTQLQFDKLLPFSRFRFVPYDQKKEFPNLHKSKFPPEGPPAPCTSSGQAGPSSPPKKRGLEDEVEALELEEGPPSPKRAVVTSFHKVDTNTFMKPY
ncbi:unnamed protein product [Caenorhabditis sp. 36 PRJEB53466]|nr:unnamed protein product [Caenorhabditis sp. 36 PRJEB53466]